MQGKNKIRVSFITFSLHPVIFENVCAPFPRLTTGTS